MKKTLEQILKEEKANRVETGAFGIIECKKFIKEYHLTIMGRTLFEALEQMVEQANYDIFFNKRMILACWELINEQ